MELIWYSNLVLLTLLNLGILVWFIYKRRRDARLQLYEKFALQVRADILNASREMEAFFKPPVPFVLTPEVIEQSDLRAAASFMDSPGRISFEAISKAGRLNGIQWGIYWMVVFSYFKRTLFYGDALVARNVRPLFDRLLERADAYQAAGDAKAATDICIGILLGIERDLPLIGVPVRRLFGYNKAQLFQEMQAQATERLRSLSLFTQQRRPFDNFRIFLSRKALLLPWERKYRRVWKPLRANLSPSATLK